MSVPKSSDQGAWAEVNEALKGLGLNDMEISVYHASLTLGPRPASIIAEKAGLKRSHTYNILATLEKKGIVHQIIKNSVRHFSSAPPATLIGMLENQLGELEHKKKSLEDVLPQLQSMIGGLSRAPKVKFFQGKQGIREIFEDILRSNAKEMCSFVDLQFSWSSVDKDMRHWVKSFITRREQRDIWWRAIAAKSETSDAELKKRSAKKRKVKVVDGMRFPAEINIYANKVALTSTTDEMVGVVIENEPIVETFKNIHQYMWDQLPDFKAGRTKG